MTTEAKRDTAWQYTGDLSPEDYGGKWLRRVTGRQFQVIELTNMDEAIGERDNAGCPTYVVELSLVDLDAIDSDTQMRSLHSVGQDPSEATDLTDAWRAIICYEYGCKAPLESWEGYAWGKLLKLARKLAYMLKRDAREMERRMALPINKIGSTAAEYMRGDIGSALQRGVAEGRHEARLMAKLYGADQFAIDQASDARPTDWLPYMTGYQDGIRGEHASTKGTAPADGILAPEYEQGYQRGVLVTAGEAVPPDWIKLAK